MDKAFHSIMAMTTAHIMEFIVREKLLAELPKVCIMAVCKVNVESIAPEIFCFFVAASFALSRFRKDTSLITAVTT